MKEMYQLTATQVMKHFDSPHRRTDIHTGRGTPPHIRLERTDRCEIETFMETFSGTISGFSCNHSHYCGNHIRTAW